MDIADKMDVMDCKNFQSFLSAANEITCYRTVNVGILR
jgi:hypothetical protein